MSQRSAEVSEALATHIAETAADKRVIILKLEAHEAEDSKRFRRLDDGLHSLAGEITKISRRLTWASGAIWAAAAILAFITVGVLTVGKFAAERWIREISDKAVEASVLQQKWGRP